MIGIGIANLSSSAQSSIPQTILLDKNWEFCQAQSSEWLPAQVPGTIHQDLLTHKKLPNPFYGTNEYFKPDKNR